MWSTVNELANGAVDAWLWAFKGLPTTAHLIALALPVAVLALVTYRFASNQRAIHAVKNRLKAHLLEQRLFQDDLAVTLRAQGRMLKDSARYMGHALVPMSVMIVPILLVIIQVESRYAMRPLEPGESTIIEATLGPKSAADVVRTTLTAPPGLKSETPALTIEDERKVLWRVLAERPGAYELRIRVGEREYSKAVLVAVEGTLSPAVYSSSDIRTLGYPMEPALERESSVSSVEMTYPRGRSVFAGLSSASWILFGASLAFGYLLRGLFGVTF